MHYNYLILKLFISFIMPFSKSFTLCMWKNMVNIYRIPFFKKLLLILAFLFLFGYSNAETQNDTIELWIAPYYMMVDEVLYATETTEWTDSDVEEAFDVSISDEAVYQGVQELPEAWQKEETEGKAKGMYYEEVDAEAVVEILIEELISEAIAPGIGKVGGVENPDDWYGWTVEDWFEFTLDYLDEIEKYSLEHDLDDLEEEKNQAIITIRYHPEPYYPVSAGAYDQDGNLQPVWGLLSMWIQSKPVTEVPVGYTGDTWVPPGITVTLHAQAKESYSFEGWYICTVQNCEDPVNWELFSSDYFVSYETPANVPQVEFGALYEEKEEGIPLRIGAAPINPYAYGVVTKPVFVESGFYETLNYFPGEEIAIKAEPGEDSEFTRWFTNYPAKVDDLKSPETTFTMPDGIVIPVDPFLTANFNPKPYTLTIESTEGGRVTKSGERYEGTDTIDYNEDLDITAEPYKGYEFKEWTGSIYDPMLPPNYCILDIDHSEEPELTEVHPAGPGCSGGENMNLNAHFEITEVSISVEIVGSGRVTDDRNKIDCDYRDQDDPILECYNWYEAREDTVVLTAEPAAGWQLDEWMNCENVENNTCTLLTDESHSIAASFEKRDFALISPEDDSVIEVEGAADEENQFKWEHPDPDPQDTPLFTWLLTEKPDFTTPNGPFEDPDLIIDSDEIGTDTTLTLTNKELDDFLDEQGVDEGEEYNGVWMVKAEYGQKTIEAKDYFTVTLNRGEVIHIQDDEEVPEEFTLKQNYPNPFNTETQIRYAVSEQEDVYLSVYNLIGQKITTLVEETKSAGWYEVQFNASGVSSGILLYRLEAGEYTEVKQMMVVK